MIGAVNPTLTISWGWDYFGSNRSVAVLTGRMPPGSTGATTTRT